MHDAVQCVVSRWVNLGYICSGANDVKSIYGYCIMNHGHCVQLPCTFCTCTLCTTPQFDRVKGHVRDPS